MKTNNPSGAGKVGPRRRFERIDLTAIAAIRGRITAMEPQQHDPKRRSVFIEGDFVLGLHEETIILERLRVGQEVSGDRLVEAFKRDEGKRAWDDALRLLSARAYAAREIERRLVRRYPAEVIGPVVDRLLARGWLDDAAFSHQFIRSHRDHGERRLLQELLRKGVARTVAQTAIEEGLEGVDAVAQARAVAQVRLDRMTGVDRETAQRRLAGYLARRGHGFDTISQALGPLMSALPRAPRQSRKSELRWKPTEEEQP